MVGEAVWIMEYMKEKNIPTNEFITSSLIKTNNKKVKGGGAGAGLAVGEGGRGGRSSGGGGDKVERKEWQRVLDLYFQLAAANLAEDD